MDTAVHRTGRRASDLSHADPTTSLCDFVPDTDEYG
jgi:hypothetical protein